MSTLPTDSEAPTVSEETESPTSPVEDAPAQPPTPWQDLSARATVAPVDTPFGSDSTYAQFFDRLARALFRDAHPRHVLLVRERGVAEQAVLIELARRGLEGGEPPFLRDRRVGYVDVRRLPAEAARPAASDVLGAASRYPGLILAIDGFANLLRPSGGLDNRSFVLSVLATVECRVIGIVSPREHEELLGGDAEVAELFTTVHLHEPEPPVATEIARHFAAGLKERYGLEIEDEAVARSVKLSDAYILHERLPYKAVNLLRAVCDDVQFDRTQRGGTAGTVTAADVTRKVAELTDVPAETLDGTGGQTDYAALLRESVVGQEHVIREVATELSLIKAGLVDPGKPASVILLIGQTGTGKTELAKALARIYSSSKRLKTFTLGNFAEPHSVSGLIGVPAGYVGHERGGRLINELNHDPYGVFLLDEADKSHPDVLQPFLNLFDEGWVYDQRGVRARADRAIFVLTTNVGQRQIAEQWKNGKPFEEIAAGMKETLSRIRHTKSNRPVFTPEFLARIKRIIVFRPLEREAMAGIAAKLIAQQAWDWRRSRGKDLVVDPALVEALADRAHELNEKSEGKEGGRVVRRLLADLVDAPVQSAIGRDAQGYIGARSVSVKLAGISDGTGGLSADHVVVTFEGQ